MMGILIPLTLLLVWAPNFAFVHFYRKRVTNEGQLLGMRILSFILGTVSVIVFTSVIAHLKILPQEMACFWGVSFAFLGGYTGSRVSRKLYIIP